MILKLKYYEQGIFLTAYFISSLHNFLVSLRRRTIPDNYLDNYYWTQPTLQWILIGSYGNEPKLGHISNIKIVLLVQLRGSAILKSIYNLTPFVPFIFFTHPFPFFLNMLCEVKCRILLYIFRNTLLGKEIQLVSMSKFQVYCATTIP